MSENDTEKQEEKTWSLELYLRKFFKGIIDPIAGFFLKVRLTPNSITAIGLLLAGLAAYFIATGRFTIGGLILLIGAPLDVIDGSMARQLGEPSKFGGFIDSVTDRYSELVVLLGLLIYYVGNGRQLESVLVLIAAAGSVMVSYTKARAESLGFTAKVGLLTRVERMIVMVVFLIIQHPAIALWIIAILANFTALQRILFVHKQAAGKQQ
jgi:CDP-diacylglycerol--glycerol-3-phosphate 3-phosphatidyltransferase